MSNIPGIYISEHKMNNMDMERILVSNPAILEILKIVKLSVVDQEKAIDELVDRTPDWSDLTQEEQVAKMKAVLTIETVLYYLVGADVIRPQVDLVENGIDQEGSIVIYAYYTNMNREQRRTQAKQMSEQEKKTMTQAVNILSGNDNLVDLAKKRLEKLSAEAAVKPKKKIPKR